MELHCENLDLFNLLPNSQEISDFKEPEIVLEGEIRTLLLGDTGSGKTSFLEKVKHTEIFSDKSQFFNVETIFRNQRLLTFWDISGNVTSKKLFQKFLFKLLCMIAFSGYQQVEFIFIGGFPNSIFCGY